MTSRRLSGTGSVRLKASATAAPQTAGFIFQFERALYHLSVANGGDSVAVEWADDVSVHRGGTLLIQEQDKHSLDRKADPFGDRSPGLWRTLQIWTRQRATGLCSGRYLLVTNTIAAGSVATAIRAVNTGSLSASEAVACLRAAGASRRRSRIQTIIDDVLTVSDDDLVELLGRMEIVDRTGDWAALKSTIADRLGLDPRVDADLVIENMLGWLTSTLVSAWRRGQPGVVSRTACLTHASQVQRSLGRRRLLPRPARDVPVDESEAAAAMTRRFVSHLSEVDADDGVVLDAVQHFLQFAHERHRLVGEGEVPDREWGDRADRLRQRWTNTVRMAVMDRPELQGSQLGQLILARTTFAHLEPLADEPCNELYMTSGHYHRLADDDQVWWHPSAPPGRRRDAA